MNRQDRQQNYQNQDWQRVDARILGQILAAQNVLFVLPDETRIAEYFSQALRCVPGIASCFVCLGNQPALAEPFHEVCSECSAFRKKDDGSLMKPNKVSCGLAAREGMRIITLGTNETTYGFFVFQTDTTNAFEPYWPFLCNLANYVALSLENRMHKLLLEMSRNELENRVKDRTEELRTLNANIQRLNQDLEGHVANRTAQLEATNKELEAFCYSVSHDLRAPLRHINGYVDLLVSRCRDGLGDKGQHYVDTIAASTRQMELLIDDLLQFSRTGRAEMRRETVDMNQALQEALIPLKDTCAGRAIEWVIGNLPSVSGDFALLRQVWANLLGNAVKYTRPKEVARIEVRAQEAEGEVVFVVSDNGVGFDMQYAGKLFGVFQRLHSQEEFEGTGIGLATVQRIVSRHGGRVWAEAELNQGAKFYFALPQSFDGRTE